LHEFGNFLTFWTGQENETNFFFQKNTLLAAPKPEILTQLNPTTNNHMKKIFLPLKRKNW
jgi:hypothetical protein